MDPAFHKVNVLTPDAVYNEGTGIVVSVEDRSQVGRRVTP